MRRNLWISAVLLAGAGTPAVRGADTAPPTPLPDVPLPTPAVPPVPVSRSMPLPSTERYRTALLASDTKPGPRDEAARRLAASAMAADVAAVRDALLLNSLPLAQASAARAVTLTDTRDPSWVSPLAALLGSNRGLSDPAVAALAGYAGTPSKDRALDALRRFATGNAPAVARVPAVRALAKFPDRSAVEALVAAVIGTNSMMQSVAADALAEMTGETDRGGNPAAWQAWWAAHQTDPPLVLKSYLADARAAAAGPARVRQEQFSGEAMSFLEVGYVVLPAATRVRTLTAYLDARSGPLRALGAKLALGEVGNRQILDPALPRLRDLIADEDADVRLRAVKAVQAAVDARAGPVLVAQLVRERSPDVLRQLFQAVGKLQVLEAAPALISLLSDPRPDVATAAARTLGEGETDNGGLGRPLRARRPNLADRACAEIRRALGQRPTPALDGCRAECTKALAALGDPQAFSIYRGLLNAQQPAESWLVKAAALTGLGMLGDTRADATVSDALNDRDGRVRLAAARAMRTVGQLSEIQQLFNETNPQQEPDPSVRDAAWMALAHLFENGSVELLSKWVSQFPNDPAHRLFVQQQYGQALQRAGQAADAAANNQAIADTLSELKRYDEAIVPLQAAFDYYQSSQPTGGADKLENLVGQMLAAQLKARQWGAAAEFAGREIRGFQKYQPIAGRAFEDAAEALKRDGDAAGLDALIAAAASIKDPPLENRFIVFLRQIRDEPPSPRP